MKHYVLKSISLGVLAVSLGGCSVLPEPAPADTVYRLTSSTVSIPPSPKATVIRIDRPVASVVFQSRDVVVSPDGRRLASAAQAKWVETIPTLIQSAFVDVLEANENLIGVIPASGARTDRRVQLTVKNFEAQFDNGPDAAPLAVVRYAVTYANSSNRALLGTYTAEAKHRATAVNVSNIVEAISVANTEALTDITEWVDTRTRDAGT